MGVVALLLGAGRGERFGAEAPKALCLLAGEPLWWHAARALAASDEIDVIVPVLPAAELGQADSLDLPKLLPAVAGGRERQDSMRAGLAALPESCELVAVHDAARPLVSPEAISAVVRAARQFGAAILAVPVRDTLKRIGVNGIRETLPRDDLVHAQTPQVFRTELLREALAKAEAEGTLASDDAGLVERLGVPVQVVGGDASNLKITEPADLELAEAILKRRSAP